MEKCVSGSLKRFTAYVVRLEIDEIIEFCA